MNRLSLACLWCVLLTLAAVLPGCGGASDQNENAAAQADGGDQGSIPSDREPDIESQLRSAAANDPAFAQFIAELRRNPLGPGDGVVDDLDLAEPVLSGIADRLVRESFQNRFHAIARDRPEDERDRVAGPFGQPPITADSDLAAGSLLRVTRFAASDAIREALTPSPTPRSFNPAFTARAWLDESPARWMTATEATLTDPSEIERRRIVRGTLARRGIARTAVETLVALTASGPDATPQERLVQLARVGIPVDLLVGLPIPGDAGENNASTPLEWVTAAAAALKSSSAEAVISSASRRERSHRATVPGFQTLADDGTVPLAHVRIQLTRGDIWRGPGAGGSVDIARVLMLSLPEVRITASVHDVDADSLTQWIRSWLTDRPHQVELVAGDFPIAQWTQDDARAGVDQRGRAILLAPRYATRGEIGAPRVAGESALLTGLVAAGHHVAVSPLHFQGGNLLVVSALDDANPDAGRLLLVANAEIERNRSLGLSRSEVLDAFATEFGVDEVVSLNVPSFHLDMSVSVRTHGGKRIAFVNDRDAARDMVYTEGLGVLQKAGAITADEASAALQVGKTSDAAADEAAISAVAAALQSFRNADSLLPLTMADHFEEDRTDSGIGAMARWLIAFEDTLAHHAPTMLGNMDPTFRSNFLSFHRDRIRDEAFRSALTAAGFEVVPIPGWSEQRRSVATVNMVHAEGLILFPMAGGRFSEVDAAARDIVGQTLAMTGEPVTILPVPTGESQRRAGALHCAVQIMPP